MLASNPSTALGCGDWTRLPHFLEARDLTRIPACLCACLPCSLAAAGSGAVAPAAAAAHTAPSLGSSNSTQLGVAPLVLQANSPQDQPQLHPPLLAGQLGGQGVGRREQVPAAAAAAAAVGVADGGQGEEHEKPCLSGGALCVCVPSMWV